MLAQLAKLASISIALRRAPMEKVAVLGVLGTLAGKAAITAAKHPVATLTAATVIPGAAGEYKKNNQKFREASGQSQVPTPPGVG